MAQLSSELLGFAADARVLLLTCDDLGRDARVNAAIRSAVSEGVATTASLMVPCPGAEEALDWLRTAPSIPSGVHLTLTRDRADLPWAPVSPPSRVPSLVDGDGLLLTSAEIPRLLAQAVPAEVELEVRAQVDVVLASGLRPTHLDWHCLADGGRPDLHELGVGLAAEHGLAARVWLEPGRRAARARGLPVVDHPFVDSFALDVVDKAATYERLVRALPAGLTEWAVHPGASRGPDDADGEVRRTDHAWLVSARAREVLDEEGIVLVDSRGLQRVWREVLSSR